VRKLCYLVVAMIGFAMPGLCPAADRTATISGYVRNANGVPQMGAAVDVLSSALQRLRVFTDENGFFSASGLVPGYYTLKVSAPAFLPTLRDKINVRAGASVLLNLTLSTLFDSVQFAPRHGTTDNGDWDWVLRSTANRPVLRMLPDGSAVVVAKGTQQEPDLRGTLSFLAGSGSQGFGSLSDVNTRVVLEKSLFSTDTLRFRGDLGYGDGVPNAVLHASFSHQMPNGSKPEVALTMRRLSSPDLGLRNDTLQALSLSASNDIVLGDVLELKFGSELQSIQFLGKVNALRPFGSIAAHLSPDTILEYRYSSSRPTSREEKGFDSAPADLSETDPRMSMSGFSPALEKAHHQEIAVSHREGATNLQVAVYHDRLVDPALTGVGEFSSVMGDVLPDVYSGTFTYQGQDFSVQGMRLVLQRKLTSDVTATVDYSYGGALELNGSNISLRDSQQNSTVRYHHAVSGKISGTAPKSKTRWVASYGWMGGRSLTPVDMFNSSPGQADPFLDFFVRQPLPGTGALPGRMDLIVEVRNLLAQGYVPVFGQDGRTVYLVQSARAVRGGVAFSF
jgi:carboxypeptidase family protein